MLQAIACFLEKGLEMLSILIHNACKVWLLIRCLVEVHSLALLLARWWVWFDFRALLDRTTKFCRGSVLLEINWFSNVASLCQFFFDIPTVISYFFVLAIPSNVQLELAIELGVAA